MLFWRLKFISIGAYKGVKKLEKQIGRVLEYRPLGRPVKQANE
jgi:hypothetical protein